MTDPGVFYNREDLWTVASEVRARNADQAAQPMPPNFVPMMLPGETGVEFVETCRSRRESEQPDRLIAGRSDGDSTTLVVQLSQEQAHRWPLQVEARIDQNPQLGPVFLWNWSRARASCAAACL
jgi:uncharacterized membrane protein (UPF0182 family)